MRSISRCSDMRRVRWVRRFAMETAAQATVEAAVLLPSFLIVVLLALQPVCLLYTRAAMESAAAETARLMITGEGLTQAGTGDADEDGTAQGEAYRAFALRRLAAVPNLSIFHAGGPLSWDIEMTAAASSGGEVRVAITGAVTPLPVLGAFVGLWGPRNAQGDVELTVEVAYAGRPAWLEGSYETWTAVWD